MQSLICRFVPLLLIVPASVCAAPFTPTSDQQVLETLPARATDPTLRVVTALRRRLAANPQDMAVALQLARSYYDQVAAEGDPRYIGYAQAALAPWWDLPDPPVPVRVMRAVLRQFSHQFDDAVKDLLAAVRQAPDDGEAWSWLMAIAMVQARYADAATACEHMVPLASPLIGAACRAQVRAATGHAAEAVAALEAALQTPAPPAEQLWALTRLAETDERLGRFPQAEAAFRRALALNIVDGYLLAAYSDFLLDRGRPAEVLTLLQGRERSDLLLLRLALAAKATNAPQMAGWSDDLGARFDAARLRGDSVHEKEEARFALVLLNQPTRALALAQRNYHVQSEAADARVLLEAAIAARQPAAADPVLKWLADTGFESAVLRNLVARLKGGA